ncbi:MAG TPA: mechanosensitive ion channel domain-containing protein [Acidimicrobiales bacterium]|nr:mechanosensitive ion channel domain-containing protein [Acidimicrobiales bacterium]
MRRRRKPGSDSMLRMRWRSSVILGVGAIAALTVGTDMGNIHAKHLHDRLVAWIAAAVFLILAVLAVRAVASQIARVITGRAGTSAGSAVRLLTSFVGYIVAVFVGLGLLDVPVQHLLIGGALTGVVLGIALQQVLGNMFAGIVLLFVRPFVVGDRIRIRSGSFGGPIAGTITNIGLTYVSMAADDGPLRIPNSLMLASAVGPAPAPEETLLPGAPESPPGASR